MSPESRGWENLSGIAIPTHLLHAGDDDEVADDFTTITKPSNRLSPNKAVPSVDPRTR